MTRLRELGIGDAPVPEFDDFARRPARTTGAPYAMVNFIDEHRQYFAGLRFAGNPVVDGIGIRSYLGAPLIDRNGTALGTDPPVGRAALRALRPPRPPSSAPRRQTAARAVKEVIRSRSERGSRPWAARCSAAVP